MESKTTLRLSLFGLTDAERQRIHALSTVTRNSARTYVVLDQPTPEETDIAIVDGDDPDALAEWKVFQASGATAPVILVVKDPEPQETSQVQWDFQIRRPLMVTRLLNTLNEIPISQKERPAFTVPPSAARPSENDEREGAAKTDLLERVLVVDDSSLIRRQMELELQDLVKTVDFAENGERAIELMMEHHYDVVLLDVVLPDIDGYQVCRNFRKMDSSADTKVIMLTSKSSPFDRVRGKLAGCDAYLVKPVDPVEFKQIIGNLKE